MANGKTQTEIINLYNTKIAMYREKEQRFLSKLSDKAKQAFQDLLNMTNEDKQNQEIEQSIFDIENLISYDKVLELGQTSQEVQSAIAKQLLEIDHDFNVFGEDTSGLQALANGNYDKAISAYSKGTDMLVSNDELNSWIYKIMKRIDLIKSKNKNKKFTGYLSNLKGAYLEAVAVEELKKRLLIDIKGQATIYQSGNIKAGGRQIAEDILLVFGDDNVETLNQVLSNQSYHTKSGRISVSLPIYKEITENSPGISVKAGNSPIKFFEGNLDPFFEETDFDIMAYHQNVLKRYITNMKDNEKGRSVNKYLVARKIEKAVGENNLFLTTRNNLLTSMSKKLEYLRDNSQLYMSYTGYKDSIKGRIVE